jgi:hypothetical protein
VEVMVASVLAMLTLAAMMSFSLFSGRSFVAIANYVNMDQQSQMALDRMSKEIRQARRLTDDFSPTKLTFLDADSKTVQFVFNTNARTLVRISGGLTNTYLTDCDDARFEIFQHTVKSNTFDCYDPGYYTNASLIKVTWLCSHSILGTRANTESVQAAKITIRNH